VIGCIKISPVASNNSDKIIYKILTLTPVSIDNDGIIIVKKDKPRNIKP
jgi:hypothetical protein